MFSPYLVEKNKMPKMVQFSKFVEVEIELLVAQIHEISSHIFIRPIFSHF